MAACAVGALVCAQAVRAQNLEIMTAADPQAMAKFLEITGHEPKLEKDEGGDPKISIKLNGYRTTLWFYGCDEKTHQGCDSVQVQVSFDRKDPWPAKDAITFAEKWRYGAVYLDKEGDPTLTYDIVTDAGIPSKVFLSALNHFGDSIDNLAKMVYPDDKSQDVAK